MNLKAIARRVVARYMGLRQYTRKWPILDLWTKPRVLQNGDVMVSFEGATDANRDLLARLGAKWSVYSKSWEMTGDKAQRAFLTLDRQD